MGFIGCQRHVAIILFQTICVINIVSAIVLYRNVIEFDYLTMLMAGIALVMYIIIVALRYATTSQTRFNELRFRRFTMKELWKEYLFSWRDLDPQRVDDEIKCAMIRNEIENKTFHIMFLTDVTHGTLHPRLTDYDYYSKHSYSEKEMIKHMTFVEKKTKEMEAKEKVKQ